MLKQFAGDEEKQATLNDERKARARDGTDIQWQGRLF